MYNKVLQPLVFLASTRNGNLSMGGFSKLTFTQKNIVSALAHGSRQLPYSNHAGKGLTYYALSYSSIKLYVPYHALMVALVSNHDCVSSSGNAKRNELIFEQIRARLLWFSKHAFLFTSYLN